MPRYIDADEFVKRVIQYPRQSTKTIGLALADTPTAEVRKVKHGEWINTRQDAPMFGFYYCSLCGRRRTSPQDNFCPNCGADMRKETEDEHDL